jgi:hypothetical protein
MAEFIKPDGTKTIVESPTYEQMSEFIGGYLERVGLSDGRGIYLDEDGKSKGLPRNDYGTFLGTLAGIAPSDFVVGNVIVRSVEEEEADRD